MKRFRMMIGWLGLAVAIGTAWAEKPRAPHYRPPVPNAPAVRVDGHVRGGEDLVLTLTVLAPEHVGLTTQEQPDLFWYQSKAAQTHFELTISQPRKAQPVLEVKLESNGRDGIRRFRLAEHNVKLKANVEYRWTVAMIVDPENRSKDVIASGVIKRVPSPTTLQERLTKAKLTERAYVYADEGFWYDSLQALSDEIDEQPECGIL